MALKKTKKYEPELFRLVYISRITALALTQASVLHDISITSIKNNAENNITGVLCYGYGYFFQYVEGGEKALTNLKNELIIDKRHDRIKILDFSKIDSRRFDKWVLWTSLIEKGFIVDHQMPKERRKINFHPEYWRAKEWHDFADTLYEYYQQKTSLSESDNLQLTPTKKSITFYKVLRENQGFVIAQVFFLGILISLIVFILCSTV